jgi:type II secretory pathway pseudopilin PulG
VNTMMRRLHHADEGTTLVEVLVATVILGIGVVAILTGLLTFISSADRHRRLADSNTVLLRAADAVIDPARNAYTNCATTVSYNPTAGFSVPSGWTPAAVSITSVQYWDGSQFQAVCYDADPNIGSMVRLQQIGLRVASPDGRANVTLNIVKRGT